MEKQSMPVPGRRFYIGHSANVFSKYYFRSGVAALSQKRGEIQVKIILLCIFLFGAGWTDLCCGKVRNRWLAAGALTGIVCTGKEFFPAALAVLGVSFMLYHLRMMGAGDGKLMALISGYLGFDAGLRAIGMGMAVGAVWSLCRFWRNRGLRARLKHLSAYIGRVIQTRKITAYRVPGEKMSGTERGAYIPLAACMAAGTYLYLLVSCAAAVGRRML